MAFKSKLMLLVFLALICYYQQFVLTDEQSPKSETTTIDP